MEEQTTITIETMIQSPIQKVWEFWTEPEHITKWAFASNDWEAPHAENDLTIGGKFKTVMSAKDKSASFDFTGTYTNVKVHELIEYDIDDGRHVKVLFEQLLGGIRIIETFEPEKINSKEAQAKGWQAILDNFKKYSEDNQ
jgi:uncharacterized protein YndB with AHSA1/START domain